MTFIEPYYRPLNHSAKYGLTKCLYDNIFNVSLHVNWKSLVKLTKMEIYGVEIVVSMSMYIVQKPQ